ncbi:MAG: hypothetical protein AAGJ73_09765 [Pseudomonadota bacterium]
MKKTTICAVLVVAFAFGSPAYAGDLTDLVGTWEWEDFTIDVEECGGTVCATISDGPSNVGEEMFLTAPEESGDGWTAEVMHPATGDTYYSQFTVDGDVWSMEGCTASGVCASGDFIRI